MGTSKPGIVFLVGAGPGDPGLLTVRAAHVLKTADVLLYDALASEEVVALASGEKRFVGKRGGRHAMTQDEIDALIVRLATAGKRVARLKGGDPFVFGRGGEEAQNLAKHGIPFEIIPGISSAIAAPAYAGIPITHRDHSSAFTVITGHEDPTKLGSTLDIAKLADPGRTLIFLMAMSNLEGISARLHANGLPKDTPVAVVQDGTRPTQRTVVGTLDTIAADVERGGLGAPAVVIVGAVVGLREQLRWFDTMPLFGKRVLVTRPYPQSEEFASALLARGAQPIVASTVHIVPPDVAADVLPAAKHSPIQAWAVFTSQTAVEMFFTILEAEGKDARFFSDVRIAAIGPKTAQALLERGIVADLVPASFVGEELARELLQRTHEGEDFLILRAQEGRDDLPRALQAAGREVEVVSVYLTATLRSAHFPENVASADILTFTSASTVRGFLENFNDEAAALAAAHGRVIACIGPVTADAARTARLHVDVTATTFTTDGMIAALEEHFRST